MSFLSLAFNPYEAVNASGRASVTQLAVSAASVSSSGGTTVVTPVAVTNLSTPITFALPPPLPGGAGTRPACEFWQPAPQGSGGTGSFSSEGCIAVPNPLPPGVSIVWASSVAGSDPALLALAWSLRGAPAAGCETVVVDCRDPQEARGIWGLGF